MRIDASGNFHFDTSSNAYGDLMDVIYKIPMEDHMQFIIDWEKRPRSTFGGLPHEITKLSKFVKEHEHEIIGTDTYSKTRNLLFELMRHRLIDFAELEL